MENYHSSSGWGSVYVVARNDDRRKRLADAGLVLLAREGARGLTHRAVDRQADVPLGTTSNYFRSRDALIEALVHRIGERLTPTEDELSARSDQPPSSALFADYLRDLVRRLLTHREVAIALFELRLEGTRRPEVAETLGNWIRGGFQADVAFTRDAGLPGGEREIALFHYAIDGLILDQLTTPLTETPTDDIVETLAVRLLPTED